MSSIVITYLEMLSPTEVRAKHCADPRFWIKPATVPQWEVNRFLYGLVGGPWAWIDKRDWTDADWRAYVESGRLFTFVAYYEGSLAGYYELQQDEEGGVEIAYFGLTPKFLGRGFGGPLLSSALEEAWRLGAKRVWVHTCSLDHPAAVANYQARGMRIYKVETREPVPPQ